MKIFQGAKCFRVPALRSFLSLDKARTACRRSSFSSIGTGETEPGP
jgi:hypothetical protein